MASDSSSASPRVTALDGAFLTGVIEGFYGHTWPHATRLAYAQYLSVAGFNTYLYCPKSDAILRREWPARWAPEKWREMQELASNYRQHGIFWGVGISPFELYLHYGAKERRQLRDKMAYLSELEAPILAVLFDDMPGDHDALASRQVEIVCDVQHWLPEVRILVCPTYYSYDPLLEQHFGQMPEGYWSELGSHLPQEVDVFWTGNQVCSDSIVDEDLEAVVSQLQRPVTLWDNYPVNDGRQRCEHLYTSPLSARSLAAGASIRGHLCNPMNQALLSLPALSGLSVLYGGGGYSNEALSEYLGKGLYAALLEDAESFEIQGRVGLGEQVCAELASRYAQFEGAAADEIVGWLEGKYRFDPACLTG